MPLSIVSNFSAPLPSAEIIGIYHPAQLSMVNNGFVQCVTVPMPLSLFMIVILLNAILSNLKELAMLPRLASSYHPPASVS